MSQAIVYKETVALLKLTKEFKTVDAWRNQVENWKKEDGFLMPACFVRMESSNFKDIGGNSGHQQYDLLVTLMICIDVHKGTEFDKILELKQRVFKSYHRFEPTSTTNIGRFLRNGEEMQIDYDNIIIYGQSYLCQNCWDFEAQRITTPATIDIPVQRTQVTITTNITN